MVYTVQKIRYDVEFPNIQRMKDGVFKGDGVLNRNANQKVTIQGNIFENGEVVFVFNQDNGDTSWRWIGSGNIDKKNAKMIKGTTSTIYAHLPWTATFSGLNNQLGTKWVWSSKEEPDDEKSESVMYSTAEGKSKSISLTQINLQ